LAGVQIGGIVAVATSGLPLNLAGWTLTIGGVGTTFGVNTNGLLTATIPGGIAFGPEPIQLTSPAGAGPSPILVQVDEPPPVIIAAVDTSGPGGTAFVVSPSAPANAGDAIILFVSGLAGGAPALPAPNAIWITVGSAVVAPFSVTAVDQKVTEVEFVLPASPALSPTVTLQNATVTLGTGSRLSAPFSVTVTVPPAAPAPAAN
jgi:hypothetical protein